MADCTALRFEEMMAVRVAPEAERQLVPGDEGLGVLVLGGVPGKPYEPPELSKLKPPKGG